jgi:pimeloyl-ACP methyl ester carboxylesterase
MILATVVASLLALGAPGQPQNAFSARFERGPCPFPAAPDTLSGTDCGHVEVPEDWDEPGRRTIRIPVAVFRATDASPGQEAVIVIGGGPRPGLVTAAGAATSRLRHARDLVLFDYRGMGYGDEVCPGIEQAYLDSLVRTATAEQSAEARRGIAADCRAWAADRGIHLPAYNAVNMAQDVIAIVASLGYDSWNVLATSFGTIPAQIIMRHAPAGLRAVVLQGPVPLYVESIELNTIARAIELLESDCARQPGCAAAFPDIRGEFEALHDRLEREPIPLTSAALGGTAHLTGAALSRMVVQMLYTRASVAAVPMLIRETSRGNAAPASAIAGQLAPRAAGINGVNWAANCHAQVSWAGAHEVPARSRLESDYFRLELRNRCDALGVRPPPRDARLPVESGVPTLILAGEHDPVTPPEYARAVARTLTQVSVVEMPGRGHEFPGACAAPMVLGFLDNPLAPVDGSCFAELPRQPFITNIRAVPGLASVTAAAAPGGNRRDLVVFAVPLLVLLSALVAWPVAIVLARVRSHHGTAFERRALWMGIGLAALTAVFVAGLSWIVMQARGTNPMLVLFGVPGAAAPLMLLPWLVLGASMVLVVLAVNAWKRGAWGPGMRVHFTLVAAAGLLFSVLLFGYGLI